MLAAYWRLLRQNRNFRRLWLAQVVSEAGDWFYSLVIYTMLLDLTGQATSIALALVFQVLPQTFAGPAAGVINDRLSRKQVMIVTDVARIFVVLAMLLVRGASETWLLYLLLTLETVMAAFFEPARNAVVPNIVSSEEILTANTLSASTWSFILAVGATLGGIIAALFGRTTVFVLNALSFLASALLIGRMTFHEPHRAGALPFHLRELFDFSPTLDGFRYMRQNPRLVFPLFLKISTGILAASWVVFPIYASKIFLLPGLTIQRNTMLVTSLLAGARGVGALLGPLLTSGWAGDSQRRMSQIILGGFVLAAAGYAIFASASSIPSAAAGLLIAHSGGAIIWVNSTTLLQINSEDRFRGRVFAADLAIAMLTVGCSGFAAGQAIDHGISPRTAAWGIAVAEIVLGITWAFALRLWNRDPSLASEPRL
jgi:predicted MFS family arabinose efflux permease